jgi:hypothetical protein
MKRYETQPAKHRHFGTSKRFETSKDAIPKGLDEKEFEQWLWRSEDE